MESTKTTKNLCKLKKFLYGLKQPLRAWFDKFSKVVKTKGYLQCESDHTLFIKHSCKRKIAIIIVYVDDIILTRDHEEEIRNLKLLLAKKFEVKDFNNLKYFLGMEVVHSKKDLCVSQRK